MKVLVTGGRGMLGRPTAQRLVAAGHDVTITSRHGNATATKPRQKIFDLETGSGAVEAVADQDVIVHLASDTARLGRHDVAGTKALLAAAESADIPHIVYISIVGCDEIPFPYYERKTAVERLIEESPVPSTILRTTQYHGFAGVVADRLSKTYVTFVPSGVRFQSLDVDVAATRLAELADAGAQGRVEDLGGPEAHLLSDLVKQYLEARGKARPVLAVPLLGGAYRGFVAGKNLAPNHADHTGRTWSEWLTEVAGGG